MRPGTAPIVGAVPSEDHADSRSPLERLVVRDIEEQTGRPLSARARQTQRALDSYLRGAAAPRWMERLNEIERGMARERRRLIREREALLAETAGDPAEFARRWEALARGWRFDELN